MPFSFLPKQREFYANNKSHARGKGWHGSQGFDSVGGGSSPPRQHGTNNLGSSSLINAGSASLKSLGGLQVSNTFKSSVFNA